MHPALTKQASDKALPAKTANDPRGNSTGNFLTKKLMVGNLGCIATQKKRGGHCGIFFVMGGSTVGMEVCAAQLSKSRSRARAASLSVQASMR